MNLGLGLGLNSFVVMGGGGGEPVTNLYDASLIEPYTPDNRDTVTYAGRTYIRASSPVLTLRIKGSSARLVVLDRNNYALGVIKVSVDGGAFSDVDRVDGWATLFSGLSDEWHTVSVLAGTIFGNTGVYLSQTGDALEITGASPQYELLTNWTQFYTSFSSGAYKDNPNTSATPAKIPRRTNDVSAGANVVSVAFSGAFSRMCVQGTDDIFVSVDGGPPTIINPDPLRGGYFFNADGISHDYIVWGYSSSTDNGANPYLCVGADSPISAHPSPKRLHHIGHSIVNGVEATSHSYTDMMRTAARNGYAPSNFGVSGNTIADVKTRIDALLGMIDVAASDVAVVDLGRNDRASAMTTVNEEDYTYILDALKTAGYGKILCLGQLYESGWNPSAFDASLSALVSARSDASVIYIDRADYGTGISRPDGVHPDDAGYLQMDVFNQTYIDPYL